MKKLIILSLSFVVLFSSVFAYAPTAKDSSIVNSIGPVFASMAEEDPDKAEIYLTRLNWFSQQFQSSNPRYSYIFWALADYISEALLLNIVEEVFDYDYEVETLSDGTRVYSDSVCGHIYYRWPRWGCYYVNWNWNKIYDTSKVCCSNQ